MQLRDYQQQLVSDVREAWARGAQNVVMQLATGGGKSECLAEIVGSCRDWSFVIAHRNELVSQLSMTLAKRNIPHNLVCSEASSRVISQLHAETFGRVWYDPSAPTQVASVDTLVRREGLERVFERVKLGVIDEGHHVLKDNKWGAAFRAFTHPAFKGLLPTATPRRADKKGLGRHADGLADALVRGPTAGELMERGYLTRYKVVLADSHLEAFLGDVAASGDWSTAAMRRAVENTRIVGDVVSSYMTHGLGCLGITFTTDVKTAQEIKAAYVSAGVPAEVLTGDVDPIERRNMLRRFSARQTWQLVAVDVVSEGFDLPSVEVVTMARPTQSLATFLQQFGRGLRPFAGKTHMLLIDHVGNFLRHGGGPEMSRPWDLDRVNKRAKREVAEILIRVCLNAICGQPYERHLKACPHCGTERPPPEGRGTPEQVEGELRLLDDAVLEMMRAAINKIDRPVTDLQRELQHKGAPGIAIAGLTNKHLAKQEAQRVLREAMGAWGYARHVKGLEDGEMQRLFWHTFALSTLEAQALGIDDARRLTEAVTNNIPFERVPEGEWSIDEVCAHMTKRLRNGNATIDSPNATHARGIA
jgi:superfamily II DNA or RNA helicase